MPQKARKASPQRSEGSGHWSKASTGRKATPQRTPLPPDGRWLVLNRELPTGLWEDFISRVQEFGADSGIDLGVVTPPLDLAVLYADMAAMGHSNHWINDVVGNLGIELRSPMLIAYDTGDWPAVSGRDVSWKPSEEATDASGVAETPSRVLGLLKPTVPPAVKRQAELLHQRLATLGEEFGLLRSADVASLSGRSMKNTSAAPTRWEREGKVMALKTAEGNLYPGYQFDLATGQPLPIVAELISLWGRTDPVGLALWCIAPNSWLERDARPVDQFGRNPDSVLHALRNATAA